MLIAGVKALLPSVKASKPNLWGYRSLCTFTPISSFILFWAAAILFIVRARIMSQNTMKGTYISIIVLSVLFISGIIFYSYKYVAAKKDGTKYRVQSTEKKTNKN